ncbi:hypothethical protein (plasmid) [Ralstonia solanacearum PSI07]|nr:hypothethical protein [Ralstonia solanacearum PSI07]
MRNPFQNGAACNCSRPGSQSSAADSRFLQLTGPVLMKKQLDHGEEPVEQVVNLVRVGK